MTLLTTSRRNAYAGSGITGPYAFGFPIFVAADLLVTVYDAAGVATVLSEGSNYTITGVGKASGSITLLASLGVGKTIVLERERAYEQTTDIRNQGPYYPDTVEKAFDSVVMLAQQLRDKVLNAFSLPATITPGSASTAITNFVAGYYLRVNLLGSGIEGVSSVIPDPGFLQSGTGAVTRTANAKMAEGFSFEDFGAVGDGTTDDTLAITRTIAAALALRHGAVKARPGARYRCTATIAVPGGLSVVCDAEPAGGIDDAVNAGATFLHDFVGDMFVFANTNSASGGGMRHIRIVQVNGTPATTGGVGRAIVLVGADVDHRPVWMRWDDVIVEECFGTHAPWTKAIAIGANFNGASTDLRFSNIDTHVSSSGAGTGALSIDGDGGFIHFTNCTFSENGDIDLGRNSASWPCKGLSFSNVVMGGTVTLDYVQQMSWYGGIIGTVASTANVTGPIVIMPGQLVNAFSGDATGHVFVAWFDNTKAVWRSNWGPSQTNSRYYGGFNAAGSASIRVIGVNPSDHIAIAPDGDAVIVQGPMGFNNTAPPAGKLLLPHGCTADDIADTLASLGLTKLV